MRLLDYTINFTSGEKDFWKMPLNEENTPQDQLLFTLKIGKIVTNS